MTNSFKNTLPNFGLPALGGGVGLRHAYFEEILATNPKVGWFEIISEDFMDYGGYERECLEQIRKSYPIIGHGVCMSVGSTDPLDYAFLKKLRTFLDSLKIPWASDHLCFTMVDHTNLNDLIPLPFTSEAVNNCVSRLKEVQDNLGRPFLVENVTRYITVSDREMGELDFLNRVLEESGCGLLLDVTNVFLNSKFHGYDPYAFIKAIPAHKIGQMHLAGWEPMSDGTFIDSHDAPVPTEVWKLFEFAVQHSGRTSALIEWDKSLPSLSRLIEEAKMAENLMDKACDPARVELRDCI
jgi:uncharacterized protein (UPF0276 family)